MKYMNFNNSCFFTVLANLLEEYDVHVEDTDIIKDSLIRYVFDYHEEAQTYMAGYQIQSESIINHYLSRFDLMFVQKKYNHIDHTMNKTNMIRDLKSRKNCVVSLKVLENKEIWHATIFKGYKDNTFKLLNMKHLNSNEPDYYEFKENELVNVLADVVQFGWIERNPTKIDINIKELKKQSLSNLMKMKNEIIESINLKKTKEQRLKDRERLFRPLLSYYDVLSIIGETDLTDRTHNILQDYVKTFGDTKDIMLNHYINESDLINLINGISRIIKGKRILMIMHATAWSDKLFKAKAEIQTLIDSKTYDEIIEFIPDRKDILERRYLKHKGRIIRHSEISPVPYLQNQLSSLLNSVNVKDGDIIHITGGVLNDSEGCLNMLDRFLKQFTKETRMNLQVEILTNATY